MTVIDDSLLCLVDQYEQKTIAGFNLNSGKLSGRYVFGGRGPGEVTLPVFMLSYSQKEFIHFFQRNTGILKLSIKIP